MRRLLRYLADSSLRGVSVTEKRIASAVLMKDNFDPQIASLVRKEMSRLRDKLSRYYLSEGASSQIRIEAPDGYAVVFREIVAEQRAPTSCWLVLPFRSLPELNEVADRMLDEINIELDREGCVELIAPTTALAYRGRAGDVRQFAAECSADYVVEGSLRMREGATEMSVWLVEAKTGKSVFSIRLNGLDAREMAGLAGASLLRRTQAEGARS